MSTAAESATPQDAAAAQALPVVRFDQVSLRRDGGGLRALSFALAPGSFHVLCGPRGAGKTSLLRLICLLEAPSQGMIQLFGRDVSTLNRREAATTRRRIGAALQPFRFLDHLSVRDNAALPARAVGRPPADYDAQVDQVLGWLGLARLADERPAALDAAARWRLALARAVVNRPEVLILDEPDEAVDAAQRERCLHLAEELNAAGAAVLAAASGEAAIEGRRLLRLQDGRLSLVDGASS